MSQAILHEIAQKSQPKALPDLRVGYTVKIHQRIKEADSGKERIQIYEGLIIKMNSGFGASATMTVRRVIDGVGVEKIFPIQSPMIAKIEVVKIAKVRKAKLYHMRELRGKSAKLKETWINTKNIVAPVESQPVEAQKEDNLDNQSTETEQETIQEPVVTEVLDSVSAIQEESTEEAKTKPE